MKNSVRKLTAWVLALIMVLSMSPISAFADTGSAVHDERKAGFFRDHLYTIEIKNRLGFVYPVSSAETRGQGIDAGFSAE